MTAVLELSNLDAYYGASHVLHDLSLTVGEGEVVLLIGRNGAGKTTLLRSIMGLVTIRRGAIRYRNHDITGLTPHRIARLGIGLVPEDRRMFATLTVTENLELGRKSASAPNAAIWNRARIFELFPALESLQERKAGNLSGGQQQMVAVARTLLGNPGLLLLDEPAEGLAPVVVQEMSARLARLRATGQSILISEQNLSFARSLADRAYVLETGHLRHQGTIRDLDANPQAWTKYVAF